MNRIVLSFSVLLAMAIPYTVHASVEEGETNAAVWYESAIQKLHIPTSELERKISDVVTHGWRDEHSELQTYLQENVEAIADFEHGARLSNCDFLRGRSFPP